MIDRVKGNSVELFRENRQLEEQLQYLRSGEYINQLKFERDMLQNVVDNGEVSKEDKEFIDMTHRNTELLEQLKQRDEVIDETIKFCNYLLENNEVEIDNEKYFKHSCDDIITNAILKKLQKYKGDNNG